MKFEFGISYTKATTLTQAIAIFEKKGIRYEIDHENKMLGVMLGRDCWTWFLLSDAAGWLFNHTYSWNTGATKKGVMHRMKKQERLKRLGIELDEL